MIPLLTCCGLETAMFAGSRGLSCLFCIFPWKRSPAARILTALFFFLFSFLAYAIYYWMDPIMYPPILDIVCTGECYKFYGVYRVILGMAIGYLGLCLSLIGVSSNKSPRSLIQDGFWPLKLAYFIGLIGLLFYAGPRWLLNTMFVPSCLLSALFLLAQSILLVDFSYDLADWLLERAEAEEGFSFYQFMLVAITFGSQAFTAAASIYMWINYDSTRARLTNMITTLLSIVMIVCSLLDNVREANPNAGIFQSSLLGSYIMFIFVTGIVGDPTSGSSPQFSGALSYIAASVTIFSVAYSAYSTGGSSHKLVSSSAGLPTTTADISLDTDSDGEEITEYNYSLYQFVFVCASLYTGLLITRWRQPAVIDGVFSLVDTQLPFWIKVCTGWIIALLYIWSLFAPLILNHRDFY